MGTNHYWDPPDPDRCVTCGRSNVEEVHLGKVSAGWVYSLQAFPDEGIVTLEQVVTMMTDRARHPAIRDEYGHRLTLDDWLSIVVAVPDDGGHLKCDRDRAIAIDLRQPPGWASFGSDFS